MKSGCIVTNYCDDKTKDYNLSGKDLTGQALCPDKVKKPMPTSDSKATQAELDKSLKVAGQRNYACKNKKKVVLENPDLASTATAEEKKINELYWAKTAKTCFEKASKLQAGGECNFFMHSAEYPVKGCYCCDDYDPVADPTDKYTIFYSCNDDDKTNPQKCF